MKKNGQRTYFMNDHGRWVDSESGLLDEEPWLVQEGRQAAGVDPGPGDVHPQLAEVNVPQPAVGDDVGQLGKDQAVAGDPLRLENDSPQRLRRSCRARRVPRRLQQVRQEPLVRTTTASNNLPYSNIEERRRCLKSVADFFQKSPNMLPNNPTERAPNYYEELFEKLDRKVILGDAQVLNSEVSCVCLECQYGKEIPPCLSQPCHLCRP